MIYSLLHAINPLIFSSLDTIFMFTLYVDRYNQTKKVLASTSGSRWRRGKFLAGSDRPTAVPASPKCFSSCLGHLRADSECKIPLRGSNLPVVSSIRIVAGDDDKTEGRRSDIMMMDDMEMMMEVDMVDIA